MKTLIVVLVPFISLVTHAQNNRDCIDQNVGIKKIIYQIDTNALGFPETQIDYYNRSGNVVRHDLIFAGTFISIDSFFYDADGKCQLQVTMDSTRKHRYAFTNYFYNEKKDLVEKHKVRLDRFQLDSTQVDTNYNHQWDFFDYDTKGKPTKIRSCFHSLHNTFEGACDTSRITTYLRYEWPNDSTKVHRYDLGEMKGVSKTYYSGCLVIGGEAMNEKGEVTERYKREYSNLNEAGHWRICKTYDCLGRKRKLVNVHKREIVMYDR